MSPQALWPNFTMACDKESMRKINFDPIAAVIKHKDDDYIYFLDFKLIALKYIAYYLNIYLGL